MPATACLSAVRNRLAAVGAIGLAAFFSAAAPAAAAEIVTASATPTAHVAATQSQPAPPPPMFLEPPFDRVPAEGKAIYVNIPSYELIAFEDGREVMRSKVIVGSTKNPTPDLTANTSVVRFRPTWTPTPSMIRDEGISPETRPPGRNNPLGLLAIRLDPGMLIYLHGTNNPKLFNREKRALSHGCIRVEKWDEVAAFVLGIPVDEVHEHANGRRTFDMDTDGVPVIVRYETRFPDQFGMMQEYADVYGRDRRYAETLKSEPRAEFDWENLPTGWN